MAIHIKTDAEIEYMKEAGLVLGRAFDVLKNHIRSGISTKELDDLAYRYIQSEGCKPTFLGYGGFPGTICASVNDTIIHGIPSKDIILKEGDIISIDMGLVTKHGFQADAARTYGVGKISPEAEKLIACTEEAFYNCYKMIKPGIHVTDISETIEKTATAQGYSLIEDFGGHGIGRNLHEDPMIPNCGKGGYGPILKKNMCIAVEPMVMQGSNKYIILDDGWTVKSRDHKLTCHYENTLVITEKGCEITTVDSSVISHIGGKSNE